MDTPMLSARMKLVVLLTAALAVAGVAVVVAIASSPSPSASPPPAHEMSPDDRCAHMPEHCGGAAGG